MRLLVDTDLFCKLGIAGLLPAALAEFGAGVAECARLPALPHMLRRGSLVRRYGAERCAALMPIAEELPAVGSPSEQWLQPLVGVPQIDAGEAQLLALAAEHGLLLVSGDKRSLRALANVPRVREALHGKVVTLEAMLLALCDRLGVEEVRAAVAPLADADQTIKVCFSAGNPDPRVALRSYFEHLEREVAPLNLWRLAT